MSFLSGIETLITLAALVLLWRRTRPADPPYGRALAIAALAIVVQGGLAALFVPLLTSLSAHPSRLLGGMWGVWALQLFRAALFLSAISVWFSIVKPRLVRSWRGVLLVIALLFSALLPDVPVAPTLLMIIVFLRLKWTEEIHGWRRLVAFVATLALLILVLMNVAAEYDAGKVGSTLVSLGDVPSIGVVRGDLPGAAAAVARFTEPWERVIRVAAHLLRLQLLIAFLQLLTFPIHLRGISLRRRFTVTMVLYRVIPGTLGIVAVVLGIYFGFGLHKTRLAQEAFNRSLGDDLRAAQLLLDATTDETSTPGADPSTAEAIESADLWMARMESPIHYVIKRVGLSVPPDTSSETVSIDTVLSARGTAGTPARFLATSFYDAGAVEAAAGMTAAGAHLYLGAARARREGDRAVVAEVYTTIDSLYLSRVAEMVKADVEFHAIPSMFMGESSVTVGGSSDTSWVDSTFTVWAPAPGPQAGRNFFSRKHFLARAFIPLSDWRTQRFEDVVGAVQMTLRVAPNRLLHGIVSNTLVFTSNAVAVLIFLLILLAFTIAEFSAARTGRSIIRGILDDVKNLAVAAKRFGDGDLGHRVDVRGKDELGSLSMSFNTMAENIEQNQELLIEKERLEADLKLARDIQQRLLPQSAPVIPGLDVAGLSIPSREVGGDLFYFLPVPGGRLGLTIGDVSGKSVPAALLMSNVLAALKTEARLVSDEHEILTHLNRLIAEQVEPGRFVTFFYGVVDRTANTLRYACAGHNPPLMMGADGAASWLTEAGVPLGVIPDNVYTPAEVGLDAGDIIVLYSDGVTEAERPSASAEPKEPEFFDDHRLEDAVRRARDRSASEIVQAVVDTVHEFTGGADLSDDLTVVVVKILPRE